MVVAPSCKSIPFTIAFLPKRFLIKSSAFRRFFSFKSGNHIQQLRIFDPAADRLAQAAVQQDGYQQQRGKKYNVPDDTS